MQLINLKNIYIYIEVLNCGNFMLHMYVGIGKLISPLKPLKGGNIPTKKGNTPPELLHRP